jgi:hypothetical protein
MVNNTFTTLNSLFKEVYADKVKDLIPDGVKIMKKVAFAPKDKQPGNFYHQPVILGMEHGITFASSDDDAFNLQAPLAGVIKDATIRGNPAVLRSALGYSAASRASQGGKQSFEDATKYLVANMLRSMAKKLEIEMLYGQMGYGTVASVSGTTITITTAEWAPGIWAGAEGMPVEIRDVTGATVRGTSVVTRVDMDARTVTLAAAIPGTIGTDVIWHGGAFGKEFAGIHRLLSQTTGTIFGIDVSAFQLFRASQYPAGSAALSFTKLGQAAARATEKGHEGKLLALVNPRAWSNVNNDQAALRKYDQSYSSSKVEAGGESLLFHSQNGSIEIEPSIYVKEGYAYLLCIEDWSRVGSADMSFKRPTGDEYFRELENAAGAELRLYTDQAIFCPTLGRNVLITGIVNTA